MSVLYPKSLLWVLGPGKQCCLMSLLLVLVMLPPSQAKHTSRVKHRLIPHPQTCVIPGSVFIPGDTPEDKAAALGGHQRQHRVQLPCISATRLKSGVRGRIRPYMDPAWLPNKSDPKVRVAGASHPTKPGKKTSDEHFGNEMMM